MADAKRPKLQNVMTCKGIAQWPKLTSPDTKWSPDGEYKVGVILPAEKAADIVTALEEARKKVYQETKAMLQENISQLKGEKLAKAKKALNDITLGELPCKPVFDEEGNETGDVVLNFKMKAQRKDKKSGSVVQMAPKLFDASGQPLPKGIEIWGGSTIKVAGQINPYYIPGTNTAGAGLRLSAVQVIALRTSGGGDAASFGFGKEDGYTAPKSAGEEEGFSDESGDDDGDECPDF